MASIDIEFMDEETGNAAPDPGTLDESEEISETSGTAGTEYASASGEDPADDAGEAREENPDPAPDSSEEKKPEHEARDKSSGPDKKDLKIAELNDKYLRLLAEFDNFRKRSENEKAGMFTDGERTVLLKVLPLIDNFERALGSVPEEQKDSAFVTGMDKVYRAFTDQLKELGVKTIEAVGKEFDANYHNAVMHVDDPDQPDNIVVEEFQKGYIFRDRVLRYSMVKVAN